MNDTTVKKVSADSAPVGVMGQRYLVSGKRVSLRLWRETRTTADDPPVLHQRDYETVGYVIGGRASLTLEGQRVELGPGDSWLIPRGAEHCYVIREDFTAVEATSPPAQVRGRDAPPG